MHTLVTPGFLEWGERCSAALLVAQSRGSGLGEITARSVLGFYVPKLPGAAIFSGVVLKGPRSVEMPIRAPPSVQVTLIGSLYKRG